MDNTPRPRAKRAGLHTGARAKAWCLLIHAEASLSLSRGPGRKPGASLYTRKRLSLSHGGQGESLVPPYTRGSVSLSLSLTGARAKARCLLIHA